MNRIAYINLFLMASLVWGGNAAGQTINTSTVVVQTQLGINASTVPAIFPKLLWEKTLGKPITSFAISKDGKRIAVADETGCLSIFDAEGKKLWEYRYEGKLPKRTYEFKSEKSDTALLNISFSASGKIVMCDLGVLSTWKELHGFKAVAQYRPYKKLCFSGNGGLLWQTSRMGEHLIGGDDYVLILKQATEEGDYGPGSYSLLDMGGKVKIADKTSGECVFCSGFSGNAEYFFVVDRLMRSSNGHVVWALEKERGLEFRGVGRGTAIIVPRAGLRIDGGGVFDISSKKKLFALKGGPFLSLTENYVANMGWTKLTVYHAGRGGVVWEQGFKEGELSGNELLLRIAEDEKHVVVGSETGLRLYAMAGQEVWRLSLKVPQYSKLKAYSVTENIDLFVVAIGSVMKVYKSF